MIKFKIIYNRKKKLKLDSTALIQIAISQERSTKYIGTKICVSPKYWDSKNNTVSNKHPQAITYNAHIENILKNLSEIRREALIKENNLFLENIISIQVLPS